MAGRWGTAERDTTVNINKQVAGGHEGPQSAGVSAQRSTGHTTATKWAGQQERHNVTNNNVRLHRVNTSGR